MLGDLKVKKKITQKVEQTFAGASSENKSVCFMYLFLFNLFLTVQVLNLANIFHYPGRFVYIDSTVMTDPQQDIEEPRWLPCSF